jgi:hypothetical protein
VLLAHHSRSDPALEQKPINLAPSGPCNVNEWFRQCGRFALGSTRRISNLIQ